MAEGPSVRGLSFGGKTLLSGVDPAGRADRAAEAVEIADGTLYFCPSPLYGHGLARLLSRIGRARDCAVLCVEAEPELFGLSARSLDDALKGDPRLRVTDRVDPGGLCALVRREWGTRVFRRVRVVRLNGGWQLRRELYDELARALQNETAIEWGNAITLARMGRGYMRNAVRNLALVPGSPSLDGLSFGDAPVLALGAGPSLDGTLDALSARFGGGTRDPGGRPFRVVCVDTCLPALKARGFTPDLAVILESQHWNLGDFVGLSGWEVPAAMDLSALPRSGGVLAGERYLFFTPWTRLRVFDRLASAGLLPMAMAPLGSVGLCAVAIALRLTRGAVVTAGLDFSFTLDLFHARSSPGHDSALRRRNRFAGLSSAAAAFGPGAFPAVAKDGARVFSNPALRGYRDLFEREFASSSPSRLFDVSGGGLPLGVKTLSRDSAFALLSSPPRAADAIARGEKSPGRDPAALAESLDAFAGAEVERLTLLRDMLSGETDARHETLDALADECDYLWAHFPDLAGGSRRPARAELEAGSATAISFLKRLRVEIDPFVGLFELTRRAAREAL